MNLQTPTHSLSTDLLSGTGCSSRRLPRSAYLSHQVFHLESGSSDYLAGDFIYLTNPVWISYRRRKWDFSHCLHKILNLLATFQSPQVISFCVPGTFGFWWPFAAPATPPHSQGGGAVGGCTVARVQILHKIRLEISFECWKWGWPQSSGHRASVGFHSRRRVENWTSRAWDEIDLNEKKENIQTIFQLIKTSKTVCNWEENQFSLFS